MRGAEPQNPKTPRTDDMSGAADNEARRVPVENVVARDGRLSVKAGHLHARPGVRPYLPGVAA
eukprot:1176897-Prorocentrum_minimum.AAC.2